MWLQRNAVFAVATILIANCWGATIKPVSVEDQPKTDAEIKAELAASVITDCITPELTVEDFVSVFQGNATRPGKCAWACVFKKFDVLADNNTINFEAATKLEEKLPELPDGSKEEDLFVCDDDEILEKCTDITDEDECEAAFKFIECMQTSCLESAETSNEEKEEPSSTER